MTIIAPDRIGLLALAPTVVVRPEASTQATVLEVRAADRPGVVYLVCAALARLDVAVRSAHVDTLGPQAVDVFYLQEASAGALSDQRAAGSAHAVRAALVSTGPTREPNVRRCGAPYRRVTRRMERGAHPRALSSLGRITMSSMAHRLTRRRAAAAVAAGAALSTALFTGLPGANAQVAAEPASTPVPLATPDGVVSSYLLNARLATPGQVKVLGKAVERAGGVVVQSWPQIGVVVAHADRSTFRSDVTAYAGNALDSVGATRSVPVSEGTPEDVSSTWGHGASDYKKGAKKDVNGDVGSEPTVATVDDPRETEQWNLRMIKADRAHEITDGNRNVLVGVLDSGIDPDHPDLAANIDTDESVNCSDAGRPDTSATGWAPTTSDHGTHVAGTIGAARNGVGIVGVAPNVRMASVKVVSDDGFIYPEYAVCGFVWAGLQGMDVTNNSYYVDPFMYYCEDQPDQYAAKEAVRRAVNWSTGRGVVHAAAAGNAATDLATNTTDTTSPDDSTAVDRTINSGCEDIPAELPGVVTVSSMERNPANLDESRLSSFSNRGLDKIDVAAPGSRILSTVVKDDGYGTKSGTSMASPHVAGVLALMKSVHPDWTPAQMIEKLRAQADDKACSASTRGDACVGTPENNSYFGEGVVDALDAVS